MRAGNACAPRAKPTWRSVSPDTVAPCPKLFPAKVIKS